MSIPCVAAARTGLYFEEAGIEILDERGLELCALHAPLLEAGRDRGDDDLEVLDHGADGGDVRDGA